MGARRDHRDAQRLGSLVRGESDLFQLHPARQAHRPDQLPKDAVRTRPRLDAEHAAAGPDARGHHQQMRATCGSDIDANTAFRNDLTQQEQFLLEERDAVDNSFQDRRTFPLERGIDGVGHGGSSIRHDERPVVESSRSGSDEAWGRAGYALARAGRERPKGLADNRLARAGGRRLGAGRPASRE